MEPEPLKNAAAPRKMKFLPKAPPRRIPKAEVKIEPVEEVDAAHARDLLRRFRENEGKTRPKVEKAPAQVAFGSGSTSSKIRSFGIPSGESSAKRSSMKPEKEYMEPWDYYSYYPSTLPLRRPYSGNPALLDDEEFGEHSSAKAYDEDTTKPAIDLGLMEENSEPTMLFLQLPSTLPMIKPSVVLEGKDGNNSDSQRSSVAGQKPCALNELPAGLMGKMLIYRSGAVKLKLGDTLYDVFPGMDCKFTQDVVAINTAETHCCVVGELGKRAIITPDLDSVLDSMLES